MPRALFCAALLCAPLPATADDLADMRAALAELQVQDARLLTTGWRLAHGNAAYCRTAPLGAGLMLYDARNFARSDSVRAALGTRGDIAIGAMAAGSPAALAGLQAGEEVLAIDGVAVAGTNPVREGDTARVDGLHDRLDAALATGGAAVLQLPGKQLRLGGQPACRARFELTTQQGHARSDGFRVQIGRVHLASLPDENAFTALVAHELAHAILGHPQRLAAARRTAAAVRETEREADRLAPWLMANAGYDPKGALLWARSWVREHSRWPRAATHDGWQAREALIAAEVAVIAAAQAAGEPLDWRARFPLQEAD